MFFLKTCLNRNIMIVKLEQNRGGFMLADREFYLLNKDELVEYFDFSLEKGLISREIRRRQLQYGENSLRENNKKGFITILLNQFKDFMIMVLMVATCLSFLMGEIGDGITIFAIIILNGILGFIQEYRAEKSLAALKKLTAPMARVIRNGKLQKVNAVELVPGDVVTLETGDRVPADARVMETRGLQVDEAILTGESIPVDKSEKQLYARGLKITDQTNMLFMGTTITRGRAKAVIIGTGMETEMGRIAELLNKEKNELTPLQKRLKHLGKWLVMLSILITILIMLIGIFKGQSIYSMFMAGVSLAVAAIPEGLPAIVTLVLALGVQKMIKNKAIVRKLQAVETLGCSTVICSDKTGTLTRNEMTLKKYYLNHRIKRFDPTMEVKSLEKMLVISSICSSVQPKEDEKKGTFKKVKEFFLGNDIPDLMGDPTEIALVKVIYQIGYTLTELREKYKAVAEESFDSRRKRMSVIIERPDGRKEIWVKGATEVLLDICKYIEINDEQIKLTSELREEIIRANNSMAGEALRVLGIAYQKLDNQLKGNKFTEEHIKVKSYEKNLVLVGLVGMIDPPRPEAYEAVEKCYKAGIKPIMITGDHKLTAQVIAEDLGIINRKGQVLAGDDLKKISDEDLKTIVNRVKVYARISPEDKLRIVRTLKENGEIVAMTGDGVNDAPAVKEADIGIAMGEKGTDVTKEVSSLVLADDNFATIVKAVEEGRKIYNNIRKFIRYLLSCNTGELLAIFIGIVMGLPLPLLPIQILWVNLVTDGLPALALGMDNDSDDVMKKPPRDPQESIFAHGMISHIISQGTLIGISTMTAFLIAIYRLGADINTARTMAFTTLVFSQLFFVFSCRSEEHSLWQLSLFSNLYLLTAVLVSTIMQLAVIYLPFFQSFFKTVILTTEQWGIVLLLSTWSTIILDLARSILRNFNNS